ncbi:MAG: type II toxin-antitoxin system HicB family antitoxin [Spirochaetes bacterium]|nr:type II toxin-antitoxin system HicB family antitoxin [Spirochaetota bacterium]
MYYHFKVHMDPDDLWAECIELKGCVTQAYNMDELKENMREVLNLYLDEPSDSKTIFPFPDQSIKLSETIVKVKADPQVAFAIYLRMLRIKHHMTQKQTAAMLGLKHLYSYQRLESSKKANPALKTLEKIKEVFPEFNFNMLI